MTPLFSSALLRTQSDERLVLLVREGSERAFEAIVDRYRKPLQRFCERALSRPRSEDVVQQVLMKAWVAMQNGAEVRSLRPWLYRITRTTIFETAETPGYDYQELERSLQAAGEPESELEQRAVIRKTLAGLAALPEAQREALLRTAFDGQSRTQIAEALGLSEGAVRQLLYRARASLRTAATAVVPMPLANWLATLGQTSAGSALETGAAGSAGVIGVAKVSAIVATAGVMATGAGPAPARHKTEHTSPRARVAAVHVRKTRPAKLLARPVGPLTARETPAQEGDERDNESEQEVEHRDSQDRERGGDSEASHRAERKDKAQEDRSSGRDDASSGDREDSGDSGSGDSGD